MIIELLLLAGAGLFALKDSRTGWKRSRTALNFLREKLGQATQDRLTPGKKVERLLGAYRIRIEKFREGVAQLEANSIQSLKISEEERVSAEIARQLAKEAMDKGKEEKAQEAIIMAVNAEERAQLYHDTGTQYGELAVNMRKDLANVEGEYEIIQTKADTIRVHSEIAEMNRNLYEALSEISEEGTTPLGELIELAKQTEKEAIASTIKIQMAKNSPEAQKRNFLQLIQGSQVEKEIEMLRSSRMLTQGKSEKTEEETKAESS